MADVSTEAMQRDRPILFSASMIQALLAGRKTQTRRVLKPQPFADGYYEGEIELNVVPRCGIHRDETGFRFNATAVGGAAVLEHWADPRFAVGDLLWVREAWRTGAGYDGTPIKNIAPFARIWFDADGSPPSWAGSQRRASIHMPRWASRITLLVTDVRVQRLQDISCADAIAEGIRPQANSQTIDCDTPDPRDEFRSLWGTIHGPGAWDKNPWVVAVTFERVQA